MSGPAQWIFASLALGAALLLSLFGWATATGAGGATLDAARALVGGLCAGGLAFGAGLAVEGRLAPPGSPDGLRWGRALLWGLCLMGALGVVALGLGAPVAWSWAALLAPAADGLLRWRRGLGSPKAPRGAALWAAVLVLLIGMPVALAPPTDTDSLYQHLGLAHRMGLTEGWVGGPLHADGSRPLLLIGLWAGPLQLFGPAAAAVLHLGIAASTVALLAERAERAAGPVAGWLAPALLLPQFTFLHEAPLVGNNLPVAFAVLAASEIAAEGGRGLGLALGAALSFKYTALGGVAAVLIGGPLSVGARLRAGAIAVACLCPWWLRSAAEGLHPLFPYAGWGEGAGGALTFQHLEKYGAGRDIASMLRLPYTAVFTGEPHTFRFLGRLHPGMAAAGLLAILPARRSAVGSALGLAFALGLWAAGPQWLRHLLPILPLLCLQAATNALHLAERLPYGPGARGGLAASLAALALLDAPNNLGPIAGEINDTVALHRGLESPEAYLRRRVAGAEAAQWINAQLPAGAVVALLRSWDTALVERETLLGTVEDHVPLRHLILQRGPTLLEALREAGATHALVGPRAFTPRAYPFLSGPAYQKAYGEPEAALEDALLMGATLLYASHGYTVYALDPAGIDRRPPPDR